MEVVKERVKLPVKGTVNKDYYKVLIVGSSGKGKTYGFRNMDSTHTGFINIEDKPLPFKDTFKYHGRPKNWAGIQKCFEDYEGNPEIDVIAIDSFSAAIDILLEEMRVRYKGFDIWGNYNKHIGELLKMIKRAKKEVFMTAHYEILNLEGDPEKRVKSKGKEWEGVIEKEFTVVLYAENKFVNMKPSYLYKTVGEGLSAKCPPGLFKDDPIEIDNDASLVLTAVRNF